MDKEEKKMEPLSFVGGKGVFGAKAPGQPAFIPHRDLALCLPLILKNAVICTHLTYENQPEKLVILDTIFETVVKAYADVRGGSFGRLEEFLNVIKYAASEGEIGREVFCTFSGMFMMSVFVYIFGSKEMAIASPSGIDSKCYTLTAFMSLLNLAGPDVKNSLIKELGAITGLAQDFDITTFYETAESYLEKVKEKQKIRYNL